LNTSHSGIPAQAEKNTAASGMLNQNQVIFTLPQRLRAAGKEHPSPVLIND
jgi:hypothetical protein